MEQQKWQRRASIIICIAAAAVVAWLGIKYLLWAVLPFIIAWIVALAVTPLACWVSSRSGLPRKLCAAVLLVALLGALCGGLSLLVQRLITELGRLMTWLRSQGQSWDDQAFQTRLDSIIRRIPFVGKLLDSTGAEQWREHIVEALIDAVGRTLGGLAGLVPSAILSTVSKLPSLLLTVLVTLIACFYFVTDLDKIHAAVKAFLPSGWADGARYFKHRAGRVLRRFVRAYSVLFIINFGVLCLGFTVLKIDCVLLMALICGRITFSWNGGYTFAVGGVDDALGGLFRGDRACGGVRCGNGHSSDSRALRAWRKSGCSPTYNIGGYVRWL